MNRGDKNGVRRTASSFLKRSLKMGICPKVKFSKLLCEKNLLAVPIFLRIQ